MNTLRTILSGVNSTTPITITTRTIPKLLGGKKNTHQGRITKVNENITVTVFQNEEGGYSQLVKEGLEAENKDPEQFTLSKRTWGTRIEHTCFIEHKQQHYVEVIVERSRTVHYELDGEFIEESEIQQLPLRTSNPTSQGGLDNKVIINTIKIESILSINVDGVEYKDLQC